jgi:hypothetical protein
MAGKVQHEIPQLFLRGFLIPSNGNAEQVFVYRRERAEPFISGIDRAAAEGYFYSRLATDGSKTLDDKITDYESRLDQLVGELRALAPGDTADPLTAAEVIAHLTTRNAHLRGSFAQGMKTIAAHARAVFSDQDTLLGLLGLDESEPGPRFRERVGKSVDQNAMMAQAGLPPRVLERVAFFLAKENFASADLEHIRPLLTALDELENQASALARDSHNKVLATSVAPAIRVAKLGVLRWRVEEADFDLILPDCVAIGLTTDGKPHPLMMADADEIAAVAMPLGSRALLVGRSQAVPNLDISSFNAAAAACSQSYFLAASQADELVGLLGRLGSRALSVIEDAVRNGVYELLPAPQDRPSADEDRGDPSAPSNEDLAAPKAPNSIAITFRGDFDEALRERIAEATAQIVAEACWTVPLDRLDGITFADDYVEGLRMLDRGFPTARPVETHQTDSAAGIAQAPTVMRDGIVKGHVVMSGALARHLIGGDAFYRQLAVHALVNQLALVGCTEIFDETLPGVLLKPFKDGFDHDMQACVWSGWHGYFAARASAAFNPAHFNLEAEVLLAALREAKTEIPAARLAYRQHGDLGQLFQVVLRRLAFILEHAGDLLGHYDGLGMPLLDGVPELHVALKELGLSNWVESYHQQLAELWDRRGEWTSFDEFLALNRHTERLLWQFGIFPWRTEDGGYRVEIPLATDAMDLLRMTSEALAKGELPKTPKGVR